jgi:hypothetical protein
MKIYTLSTISPRVKDFNPREFMNSFGINYIRYIITSMSETIIYEGCTNVPEHPYQLPYYIHIIETLESQDKAIKSVEFTARHKNRGVLVTYNQAKEIISIEHGFYSEMMEKFDIIHKQLMKEKQ